ncbi:adenine nucleotide alpha hydrolase [Endomicrobiia bacterium]|nr:adenine nucleotide alpha hydrolase [Endomicrobiia bacterium]GHT69244.1 adenine nucleotide alpha hydrolase [Endomicrobiia bacterium]GHT74049.1 adenine nucleotide alpha hydrolase [Endomicrobiia bacterium]
MTIEQKYENLKQYIFRFNNLIVAFSGGVDSTFLLKTAHDILGDNAIAITAKSCSFPQRELNEAVEFCKKENIRHIICEYEELNIEGFSQNPANRCYLCKRELFSKIWTVAKQNDIKHIAEASNIDDNSDYRPGLKAVDEQGVKSPLRYAKLTKDEIRKLSKYLGLSTWNKQSFACLASRFPYGQEITSQGLSMIDRSEQILLDMGFKQVRVRLHGNLARIETDEAGFDILTKQSNREKIYWQFKKIGFVYVSLDILGYRTGSMNETLDLLHN